MKNIPLPQTDLYTRKKGGSQVVRKLQRPNKSLLLESKMNLNTITTLALLALSALALMAYSLIQAATPEPILVEKRAIRYQRRP